MYKHLMVPVDGTALSSANVTSSIKLAKQLMARISFFHATKDFAATSDGALLRVVEPELFAGEAVGETNSVLVKAKAAADAACVECDCFSSTSDHPAAAIVESAVKLHCDLIVMASRGDRGLIGWFDVSQMERVLKSSPIALLVTRVASVEPIKASERAMGVILDEHRSIAAVVRGMVDKVQKAVDDQSPVDSFAIRAMLNYMKQFPEQLHHPKEERFLHRFLRLRAPGSESLLLELECQHVREHELVNQAYLSLTSCEQNTSGAREALLISVTTLAEAIWHHMRTEESKVLPLAMEHLAPSDWLEIAEAFEDNNDPNFGKLPADEFQKVFTRIANQLPHPKTT